jgi:hypothetical protein
VAVKQYVVIDKSYLEGATSAEVRQLCAGGALMTDSARPQGQVWIMDLSWSPSGS